MNESNDNHSSSVPLATPEEVTRRRFFEKLSIALAVYAPQCLGVPVVGFVIAPLFRKMKVTGFRLAKLTISRSARR